MIKIAIVEDDKIFQEQFASYIIRYGEKHDLNLETTIFSDGYEIIEKYNCSWDIILLDIQMDRLNGLETARKIRAFDEKVILIFITNSARYAIQGYEVNALNYVLKPVSEFAFEQELGKAIRKLGTENERCLIIKQKDGVIRLRYSQISYLESKRNQIIVHADNGEYIVRDTMKSMESRLADGNFERCNSGYLVNLRNVQEVRGNLVNVSGEELLISRPRRKTFMEALTDYKGGL